MGGYLAPDEVQKDFIMAFEGVARFRQIAQVLGKGAGMGGVKKINKVSSITTAGTVVAETSTIPLNGATVSQITLTLYEYANALDSSYKLKLLSQTPIESVVGEVLGRDAVAALETAAEAALDACIYRYVGTSATGGAATTNGTATATNTSVLNAYHVGAIVDYMKQDAKIPFFDGINFLSICTVKAGRNVKNDSSFESWKMYGDPAALLEGEVGKLDGVRFVEETLIASSTGPFDSAIGSGTLTGEAYFMGENCLYELLLEREHVRQDFSNDFGRDMRWAWYAITGFGIVQNYALKWASA
jgi:N4-gp56 family major capsid protein